MSFGVRFKNDLTTNCKRNSILKVLKRFLKRSTETPNQDLYTIHPKHSLQKMGHHFTTIRPGMRSQHINREHAIFV